MPVYVYRCPEGHVHEELKPIAKRAKDKCPECGRMADQFITPVHLDWNSGLDPDFPTFADKWAKIQTKKNLGKMRDHNNDRYGTD